MFKFQNGIRFGISIGCVLERAVVKDMAILISSSGKSPNMLEGAKKAKKMDVSVITLSGFLPDNPFRKLGDLNLWTNSSEYIVVEMTHHIWLVGIVDYLIEMNKM